MDARVVWLVLCRTFHIAPEQEQVLAPIVPIVLVLVLVPVPIPDTATVTTNYTSEFDTLMYSGRLDGS